MLPKTALEPTQPLVLRLRRNRSLVSSGWVVLRDLLPYFVYYIAVRFFPVASGSAAPLF